jgi:hypothetical protein
MPRRQTPEQKKTLGRVMHEFKHRELESHGRKVRNPKQAIAIALHEAGVSREQSPGENRASFERTKYRERTGKTAQQEHEGDRRGARASGRKRSGGQPSRAELYEQAKRRGIPGRSHMSKSELARALGR